MTQDMSAPKDNPFKQEDISVVEQVKGVKSAKIKESEDSTYSAKVTNTHGSGEISLKRLLMCQGSMKAMVLRKMITIHRRKSS